LTIEGDDLDKNDKRLANHVITILVIICFVALVILLSLLDNTTFRMIGIAILALLLLGWLVIEYRHYKNSTFIFKRRNNSNDSITKLVLLGLEGGSDKEWHTPNATSFLIGKGTANREVDIELGDIHHCDYVSNEHAILNLSMGIWYIEDLGSKHGVGIRRKGAEYSFRLKPFTPYKIDVGDIIYISKIKIAVT
jgi:hypothetical protein